MDAQKNIEALYPLTSMQQGMLFHSLYNPGSGAYLIQMRCTLRGELDVDAFERAWRRLVERHAALRTAFTWQRREGSFQIVFKQVDVPWRLLDWSELAPEAREARFDALLAEDREQGFDLARAPLLRMTLVKLGAGEHRLLWTLHHLLVDGWSMARLLAEVAEDYEALRQGTEPRWKPPRPFREMVAWVRQQDPAAAERYWRERLRGFEELSSPAGRPVASTASDAPPEYEEVRVRLSRQHTRALSALAESARVTLNTVVLGAWCLLVSRSSGKRDVVVGVTLSGRPAELEGVEEMVGMFVNTLPLRIEVREELAVVPWLRQLQDRMLELQRYPHVALTEVQGWSGLARNTALFDHLFVFENYPLADATAGANGLSVEDVRSFEPTDYPLTVLALPGDELTLQLTYDRRRFPSATAGQLRSHLQVLLESLPTAPTAPLFRHQMLSAEEQRQVVETWNATATPFSGSVFPHRMFEAQVDRTPEAVALDFAGSQLSYRELDARANQLAWHLQTLGVGPESRVGVLMERSVEMVLAVLGILKAGGAYVPLDPDYPAARLAIMVEDSRLGVLLTQKELLGQLPRHSAQVLAVDEDWPAIAARPASRPDVALSPENLLYVIYTSGSTGRPKGIALSHGALGNLILWHRDTLRPGPGFLQFASLSFDASFHEMFAAWATGGCLYLIGEDLRHDLDALLKHVAAHPIDRVVLPVVVLQRWASEHGRETELFQHLREIITTGEQLQITQPIVELFQRLPQASLHNHYGPAETHVVTALELKEPPERWPTYPTVGSPIANTQAYVLDAWLHPVPVGVTGELYLGGANLARGYLERPDLTAAKFVPDPFSPVPGARLYRTGDQARWMPDGQLEFLGRLDHLVKLRGFRVELGEVEAALGSHTAVGSCAVVLREDEPGQKRLVAYYVAAEGTRPNVSELRAHLDAKLPNYMVPSVFVPLAELPLTPNGKIDRRALPRPEGLRPVLASAFVRPKDPVEQLLADAWAEVLGVDRVGAEDDFFELGGHSLIAVQVLSRVRAAFGFMPPLRLLFDHPTLAAFAARIRQELPRQPSAPSAPAPIQRWHGEEPAPLSFAQERVFFLEQLMPDSAVYNIPGVLRLEGTLHREALEQALREIVRRHAVLRSRVVLREGVPRQVEPPQAELSLTWVDLQELPVEQARAEAERRAREELARPFRLEHEPPLRVMLLRLGEREHVLSLTLSHLVADGSSIPVFLRELAALYEAFAQGRPSPLPELVVQYVDFAAWQRDDPARTLETQLDYWRERLHGLEPLQLPTDRPRPAVQRNRGGTVTWRLEPALFKAVEQQRGRLGLTASMFYLAGFVELLARYSRQRDVAVGMPVTLRDRVEWEGLIGLFLNTLVLRVDLGGKPTVRQLLERVRETMLEAFGHRDVPFERVVEALHPERDRSRAPLVQVLFDLHGWPEEPLRAGGLAFEPREVVGDTTKFDLTLTLEPRDGGLTASLEYDVDLFERSTAERMASHYTALLEAMAAKPDAPLSRLELMRTEERRQVLAWGQPGDARRERSPLLERLEQQFTRSAEQRALTSVSGDVSYGELDRRSNRVAHALRARGVGPESVVALCMDRSPELVVAVLGVLRAGAAWVPLDPTHPAQRLAFLVADSRARVVVTSRAYRALFEGVAVEPLVLDGPEALADPPDSRLEVHVEAGHLAYVLYTSGSTGAPKGCLLEHGAMSNYLTWAEQHYLPGPEGGDFSLFSPLTFDLTLTSLFLPLLRGRTLHIVDPQAPIPELPRLALRGVDAVKLTPSHLSLLAHQPVEAPGLRVAIVGGEQLTREQVEVLERMAPQVRVYNEYGPTEAAVGCVVRQVSSRDGRILIGRPARHAWARLLDEHLRPVPVGVPGELWIGGAGLARGYLGRPGLTAERFVPDPFSTEPGERLYRTGDLARWMPDGELEYLGRADQQLKIRGFRIEPGEIEAALESHPDVHRAVVTTRQEGAGSRQLVAYVEAPSSLEMPVLRRYLEQRLPAYLVPALLARVDTLPLSAHGKVDFKALPALDREAAVGGTAVEPRSEEEHLLARVWREVLRLDQVGIHDNFFSLGGDSILSLQVVSHAARLGLELKVEDLFQHQTIAGLVTVARRRPELSAEQGPVTGEVPPTPIQHWFFEQEVPRPGHFNQALLLELSPGIDLTRLEQALQALQRHHDALRLTARRHEGQWALSLPEQGTPLRLQRQELPERETGARREALERLVRQAQTSLDLEKGPPLAAVLFHGGEGQPASLLLAVHHLVVDGVSWRILLGDLELAYRQLSEGAAVELPPKSTSVLEWGRRLAGHAARPELREELPYWEYTARREMELTPDLPGGSNAVSTERTVGVRLDPEATSALVQQVPRAYNTRVDDVLLAGLLLALCDGQGRPGLRVDLEGHGRIGLAADLDLSRTVGWFTAMWPVWLELPERTRPGEVLKAVKEQLRAVPGQGLGYGLLRYLHPEPPVRERLASLPPSPVLFNYHGQLDSAVSPGGLFARVDEAPGPDKDPASSRSHLLEINAAVEAGQLNVNWSFSGELFHPDTVERLAKEHLEAVRRLIEHCLGTETGGTTASDFPEAGLSQSELESLENDLLG